MSNLGASKGKSKAAKRPFMKLFTSDYRDGTARLPFELQGFYFRILTYLHDGESVPADPATLAVFMQCSPRTTRAFVPKLIALGKLYEVDGELRNKRIDRDLEPNSDRVEPDLEPTSNSTQPEVEPNSDRTSQKPESNQEPENHTMEDSTSTAISRAIPEEDTIHLASVEQDADPLAGLNGMADRMIQSVKGWMIGGDDRCARTWLGNTTATYGQEATKGAYHKLVTDMLEGQTFAKPLQVWSKIAQRMVDEAKTKKSAGAEPSAYQAARAKLLAEEAAQ